MVYDEMKGEELSGVELLALYGENETLGAFLPGLKKLGKKALHLTPQYQAMRAATHFKRKKRLHGEDDRLGFCHGDGEEVFYITGEDDRLGAFLPGLKKVVKKVGKVTSGFTTGIAKTFLPSGVVNAVAKLDPTTKGGSVKGAVSTLIQTTKPATVKAVIPVSKDSAGFDFKKIAIIGGSAAAALLLIGIVMRPRR